ncbi:hypothetical protein ABGB07_28910 [Micromonosporaceae bacterium B7E4]
MDERGLTNIAAHGVDHLADLARQRLHTCQQQTISSPGSSPTPA